MESAQSVWQSALLLIKPAVTEFSYKNWILTLEPLIIMNDTLILVSEKDLFRDTIIVQGYLDQIRRCVTMAAGRPLEVNIVLNNEREAYIKKPESESTVSGSKNTQFNPKYTFDTFVVGESNRFACAAAKAVAQTPALAYNPLFIYGGVGLGKTHLMHAIAHMMIENNPNIKIIYTTIETFMNELIEAIQNSPNNSVQYATKFREKYRSVDVLMIDDIQFISRKEGTQLEFFHTFNALKENNKQIIITSDKHPREIHMLEERLRTRFEWGIIADILPPDIETKIAILRRKATQDGIEIGDDVLYYLADNNTNENIRELEGALNRIVAFSNLHGKPINLSLAKQAFRDMLPRAPQRVITADDIKKVVSELYGISPGDLASSRRDSSIVVPRHICIYLMRSMLNMPFADIGAALGNRHHTSIMHSVSKIEEELNKGSAVAGVINDLKHRLEHL
ncbi:MAG: chromosomal replication initiator protein DnaA [Clostridia bacterium]|nr:chromosomal replication initiator protein DnaA [Clostridia bacterium]